MGVGLLETNMPKTVSVFPNPTNDFVSFKYLEENIQEDLLIYNALGKMIKKIKLSNDQQIRFSTESFESGIYFWRLGNQSGRLIIQK